jgi:HEAT repeat protein
LKKEPLIQIQVDKDNILHIESETQNFVITACEALGQVKSRMAVPELIKLLYHDNPFIRVAAVRALGKIKDKRALEPLLELRGTTFLGIYDEADKAIKAIKERETGNLKLREHMTK